MDREQAKGMLPIVKAIAEGKPVQFLGDSGAWRDVDTSSSSRNTSWDCQPERWRVKPPPREWWLCTGCLKAFAAAADHARHLNCGAVAILVREVV